MLIGELARITGTSTRALRHYDDRGLLLSVRQTNRYRDLPESAVERVRRIRMLLDVGLNLDAVAELLNCFTTDGALGACPAAQQRLSTQIKALDEQIDTLQTTRCMLNAALAGIIS